MELNSSALYLRKIREAMRNVVGPELQTPSARMAAAIIESCIDELLHRETGTAAVLAKSNARGARLIAELQALVADPADTKAPTLDSAPAASVPFNQAAADNATITRQLVALVQRLSRSGISASNAEAAALMREAALWEYQMHVDLQQSTDAASAADKSAAADAGEPFTAARLAQFIGSVHADGDRIRVDGFRRAEGGVGKQTYFFTLHDASGKASDLVVRKAEPVPLRSHGAYLIEREYHLLKTIAATGYPAPMPLWLGKEVAKIDGNFFVMQRLPGDIAGTLLQGADKISEAYLLDVAEHLARLHAIPLETFKDYIERYDAPQLLTETIADCYRRTIEEWHEYSAHECGEVHSPVIEYLFDWLQRHIPSDGRRPVLVHGDFNIHNVLRLDDRVSGVLDWESAMFGAPEQDIAYIRPHIAQHIDWSKFVQRYLDAGGQPLDMDTLDFYTALSSVRVLDGLKSVTQKLQGGVVHDFRYCAVQLGYTTQFMQLALEGTAN